MGTGFGTPHMTPQDHAINQRRKQATSPDVRERELAQLRLRIAEAKAYGAYAGWDKIARMERRRDDLERWLEITP